MGYYTVMHLDAVLSNDTPPQVLRILRALVNDEVTCQRWPHHPYFSTTRFQWALCAENNAKLSQSERRISLHVFTEIKNYDSELENFIDWIAPYVERGLQASGRFAETVSDDGCFRQYTAGQHGAIEAAMGYYWGPA